MSFSKQSRCTSPIPDPSREIFKHPENEPSVEHREVIVEMRKVSLSFRRSPSRFSFFSRGRRKSSRFWALRNIDLKIYEGDRLGIIGRNGSGKSTLSMICTGIYRPDTGSIVVKGKVQLLALGVGFQPQLTGRENVYISGSLLGMKFSEIRARMKEIEAFAEIGDFIDEPVRTYSSGMRSRLAFAVATAIHPDVLILDEVLSTGDRSFQDKAMARMRNLQNIAKCVMIISHNPKHLLELCNRIIWLEKGRMVMEGKPEEVLDAYENFCRHPNVPFDIKHYTSQPAQSSISQNINEK